MTTPPPTIPDHLELIKKVGNGVFGSVYRVREKESPHNEYALKHIYNCSDTNKINNEIKALQLLNTQGIGLKFHSAGTTPEGVNLLLEYTSGDNLIRHVRKKGRLAEEEMTRLLADMLEMLLFMEKHSLLHLDIKPTNIIYHGDRYVLIDWGLCRWGNKVRTIRLNGNPIYFPPEMYYGERDLASEVYSLGCVLYFALTGKEIFGLDYHKPLSQKMYAHVCMYPEFPEGVSNRFRHLVCGMIEKEPQKRIRIPDIQNILHDPTEYAPRQYPCNISLDFTDEIKMFKLLAYKGVPYAQNQLSKYYQRGEGVEKNPEKAFYLNTCAANYNLAKAQFDLAVAYKNGKGADKDLTRAVDYFTRAATQGHELSQYELALMLEQGLGAEKDTDTAGYWFEQAARNGHKQAVKRLADAQ